MKIQNTYHNDYDFGYTCAINEGKISEKKFEFENLDKANRVKMIEFNGCVMSRIPQGLTKIFRNLQGIDISGSDLKHISRQDLYEYRKFKRFYLEWNQIEYLPGDLLADCKNLETVSFEGNPLKFVEPNILENLCKLKYINLNGTVNNFGEICCDYGIKRSDLDLLKLKNELTVTFMQTAYSQLQNEKEHLDNENFKLNCEKELWKSKFKEQAKFKAFIQSDEHLKDIQIIIDDKQFRAHKILLAAESPTFANILKENPTGEKLNLIDISADIFEDVLHYIYTDQLPEETDFLQLFAAAERFKIDSLKNHALMMILQELTEENALDALCLGHKYKNREIKGEAFKQIKQKYPDIGLNEDWLREDEKFEKIVEHLKKMREMEKELKESVMIF